MGLLSKLLLLPVKGPMDGTLWVSAKIHEAAEAELNNPGTIKKTLRELEKALLRGEITEDDYDDAEEVLLIRLKAAGA